MFATWHLTAQDPIAIALVILGVAWAIWLRSRLPAEAGCGGCPKSAEHAARPAKASVAARTAPDHRVALDHTRLGRRAAGGALVRG